MVALAAVIMVSCSESNFKDEAANNEPIASVKQGIRYVPGQIVIKFKDGSALKSQVNVLAKYQGELIQTIVAPNKLKSGAGTGVFLYKITGDALKVSKELSKAAEVEYAEPNYIYTTQVTSNDPYFTNGNLWGMYGNASTPANQYGSQAAEAWANNHTGSSNVWVGIIDEGYMYTHPDLVPNVGTNPGEIPDNGIDDDGNGYVDDVYGWDFDGNNNTVFDGPDDDHGTHVAGTIGARGGNAAGVAGVVWNVKMINCKFLGNNGGTLANAVLAIDYMVDLKTRHNINLVALNNSWGGGGYSTALYDAIMRANNAGILFIAAAGNNGTNNNTTASYPSNYNCPNVIAVASITNTGAKSSFSNYGSTTVHLGAPGSNITSTVPTSSGTAGYATYSGTSMATPHVAGAAALYKSTNPTATMAQIKTAILNSTIRTTSMVNKTTTGGRLNVENF